MHLKVFRAAAMAAAMAQVRAEFGANALILNTRKLPRGVEVTAALEPEVEPVVPRLRLATLAWHGVPEALRPALAHGDLAEALSVALLFGVLPLDAQQKPLILAGPPGAGKTLTAVRLATRLVMQGVTPMVISADGARAGAIEQLAAYTRILGVRPFVASGPDGLTHELGQRRNGAPVLIDTAGTNPYLPATADDLRSLACAANAEIAVVLPAGLDPAEAVDLAAAYVECGACYLITTRLDLARRVGGVIAAAAASRLPLTEAGIGPGAANGLVPFAPSVLAERLIAPKGTIDAN